MGTFSIAFDIIIVGALALPWVLLVIHLFFSDNESSLKKLLGWVKEQEQPALVSVLLFAMAYPIGSAVSRIAQDFFDDGDLHIEVFGHLFRVGMTETSIRTDVYCQTLRRGTVAPKSSDPLAEKREQFRTSDPTCEYTGRWIVRQARNWIDDQEDLAGDIFHVQEAAVLLQGTDANERLRQFRDQIMVLRGAAFDGLLAFSLCWFWRGAELRSRLRWAVPLFYFLPGLIALRNHLLERSGDPPYMEFTLLALAAAGCYVLWHGQPKLKSEPGESAAQNERGEISGAYLFLAAFLTVTAFMGWWATQILYDQQVVYSYKALSEGPAKPVTLTPK